MFLSFLATAQRENDYMVVCNVARILELVVPLMEEPSRGLLLTLEEDLMRLIIKHGVTVSLPKPLPYLDGEGALQSTPVWCVLCRRAAGGPALCELPGCRGEPGHAQLHVCVGLL